MCYIIYEWSLSSYEALKLSNIKLIKNSGFGARTQRVNSLNFPSAHETSFKNILATLASKYRQMRVQNNWMRIQGDWRKAVWNSVTLGSIELSNHRRSFCWSTRQRRIKQNRHLHCQDEGSPTSAYNDGLIRLELIWWQLISPIFTVNPP